MCPLPSAASLPSRLAHSHLHASTTRFFKKYITIICMKSIYIHRDSRRSFLTILNQPRVTTFNNHRLIGLADMLDGAMARERGGGTRFGAVLDATCDRISDGAVFCGLLWWACEGLPARHPCGLLSLPCVGLPVSPAA